MSAFRRCDIGADLSRENRCRVDAGADSGGAIRRVAHEIDLLRAQLTTHGEPLPAELLHRYFSVMMDGAQEMSRSLYPKLEDTFTDLAEI